MIGVKFWQAILAVLVPVNAAFADCAPDAESWLHIEIEGLKDRTGEISVELYPDMDGDYLKKLLVRERMKTPDGIVSACLPVPSPGRYILVVLHDRDENHKLTLFSDGFGFSNNPKIGLTLPDRADTAFESKKGRNSMRIMLNYMQGLTARPLDPNQVAQDSKRRRVGTH